MRNRLNCLVALFAFFLCLPTSDLPAQAIDGSWVRLQSAVVTETGNQTILIEATNSRASAIRFAAKGGSINLSRVVVNYGNGQTHYEDRAVNLGAGKRTPPFAQTERALPVESVTVEVSSVEASNNMPVTIEIWAQQSRAIQTEILRPTVRQRGQLEDISNPNVTAPLQKRGYFEVPVFYGTTRKPEGEKIKNNRVLIKFGNDQPDMLGLTLGRAVVTVPYDRPAGSIPRPETNLIVTSIAFRNEDPARDFTIAESKILESSVFVAEMKQQLANSKRFKNQAFVFVHGYNVSFDDAIFRTAQIAADMEFDGPAVTFSWRSAGGMWKYRHDLDTAKEARVALRDLLTLLVRDTGVNAVNLVAHSMGNDPVIEVLRENAEIRRGGGSPPDFKLNEVVLAAPDVARPVFAQFAAIFAGIAKGGITLYASSKDRALMASKRVASGIVRAGDIPKEGIMVVPGVESIDISDASTSIFSTNHGTFADRQHLVDDMGLLFERTNNKHPPSVRFPIYKVQGRTPTQWWQYRN